MILHTYSEFRAAFALVGAPIVNDGFEEFPVGYLRLTGFNTLVTPPAPDEIPFDITINGGAVDLGAGYAWYLSQRDPSNPYLTIVHEDMTKTGTVTIGLNETNVSKLLGGEPSEDWLDPEPLALLFKNCHLYVQRLSDKSYQWCRLSQVRDA